MDRVRVVYTVGHEERVLPVLPPMIACQVGQALQDASKYCGELRDAADAIASRRRLVKRHPRRALDAGDAYREAMSAPVVRVGAAKP